jgi:hypothetical protein
MITCPSCQTELPDTAAFCLSCGQPIENSADLKSPNEVDIEWLMTVLASAGYECEASDTNSKRFYATKVAGNDNEGSATNPNGFYAADPTQKDLLPSVTLTLHPEIRAFTIVSVWKLQRSRRDEARLHAALNEFNGHMPFWAAWTIDETTLGISTLFTLGLRTSARTIRGFLELASELLFKQLAVTPALAQFLGFTLNGRSAQQLAPFRGH